MRATVHEVRFRELHILITDSSDRVIARGDSALVGTSPVPDEGLVRSLFHIPVSDTATMTYTVDHVYNWLDAWDTQGRPARCASTINPPTPAIQSHPTQSCRAISGAFA